MSTDASSDAGETSTMSIASQDPIDPDMSINYVKPENPQINLENPLQEGSPTQPVAINGVSSKIVQFPGVNPNNVAYVGTLIKKGKDLVPQKVLLTPVRSKDGAITRFILPKSVPNQKMSPVRVNSSPVSGVKVCPVSSGGFIVSQTPFNKSPLGRSFVIQSSCGPTSVRSTSLLKNSNLRSCHTLNNSAKKEPKSTQLIPKPLPPATSPFILPFPNTLPPAKTFEPKVSSDVTITSVSHPMSVISPVTPLSVPAKPPLEVPPLTPINLGNALSTNQPQQIDAAVAELIPSPVGMDDIKNNPLNGFNCFECSSKENHIDPESLQSEQPEESVTDVLNQEIICAQPSPEKLVEYSTDPVPTTEVDSMQIEESPIASPPPPPTPPVIEEIPLETSFESPDPLLSATVSTPEMDSSSISVTSLPSISDISSSFVTDIPSPSVTITSTSVSVTSTTSSELQPSVTPVKTNESMEDLFISFPGMEDFIPSTTPIISPKAPSESETVCSAKTSLQKPPLKISKVNSSAQMLTARQPFLQVKELPKEPITVDRSRKRKGPPILKDCLKKTIAVKRLEPLPGARDVDPFQVIEWDQESRIGRMPGSDIKFIMNVYGGLQVFECSNNYVFRKIDASENSSKQNKKDDIAKCVECQCYGLVAEFVDEKFCSVLCKDEHLTRKALQKKREQLEADDDTNKKRKLLELALHPLGGQQTIQNGEEATTTKVKRDPSPVIIELDKEESIIDKINLPDVSVTLATPKEENVPDLNTRSNDLIVTPIQMEIEKKKEEVEEDPGVNLEENIKPPQIPVVPEVEKEKVKKIKPTSLKMISKRCATDFTKFATLKVVDGMRKEKKIKLKETIKVVEMIKKPFESLPKNIPSPPEATPELQPEVLPKESLLPCVEDDFNWNSYLRKTKSVPAWVRLFQNPFPCERNLFKVNQRLEAIDPQKQSLFCAVSVAQVKGYRIKLHFDGYPSAYDFWLNADSPNIFPCGFCASHGIELQPPFGYKREVFNWAMYLACIDEKAAPAKCFIHKQINSSIPNLFKVGNKLEAVDRKNSYLVCVATVSAVLDHRVLIHFDSWDEVYDYWTDVSSPNIHPIGWCAQNNHDLTPPNRFKKKNFSWSRYLEETGAEAAPEKAFMLRPAIRFKKGTKLEAVDPKAPHLVRVATVKQVLPYEIQIVFDGYPDHFGVWFEDDSSDLHPVGWAARTGHQLTPPPKLDYTSPCRIGGCTGDGNTLGADFENHSEVGLCPYSVDNLEADPIPDRLKHTEKKLMLNKTTDINNKAQKKKKKESLDSEVLNTNVAPSVDSSEKSEDSPVNDSQELKSPKIEEKEEGDLSYCSIQDEQNMSSSDSGNVNKIVEIGVDKKEESSPILIKDEPSDDEPSVIEESIVKDSLMDIDDVLDYEIFTWDVETVINHIQRTVGHVTHQFLEHKIDGEGFLMLTEDDIISTLNFSKAEASRLTSSIFRFRSKFF